MPSCLRTWVYQSNVIDTARRRPNFLPMTVPVRVTQTVGEPSLMAMNMGAAPKRLCEGATSQFGFRPDPEKFLNWFRKFV